jgi:hypothetical protein
MDFPTRRRPEWASFSALPPHAYLVGRTPSSADAFNRERSHVFGIERDLADGAILPLNADLDQNIDPEVAQRGRNLDA